MNLSGSVLAIVIILAITAAGAAVYFGIIPGISVPWLSVSPERTARYYPDDVLAYAWLTLNPANGQSEDMEEIWERFNEMPGFRDALDDLNDSLGDETGIDFERDAVPWIGPEISAAVVGFDSRREEIEAVAIVSVRDRDAAADFLDDWLDYLEDEQGADFSKGSEGDFDTWVDENRHQAYALSKDLLVFATTEDTLDDVLDRVAGYKGRSLAEDADFRQARAALADKRFASVYVDYGQTIDVANDTYGSEFALPEQVCDGEGFQVPDWVMGSASWVDRGIVWEVVSPKTDDFWPDTPVVANAAEFLPGNTLAFAALSFNPDLDSWRETLRECELANSRIDEVNNFIAMAGLSGRSELAYDSTLSDVLDLGLELIDNQTGIELEEDLLDHLDGDFIVAVWGFDFEAVERRPEDNPVEMVAMLSYRSDNKDALSDTMDDIADKLESQLGADFDSVDVGADNDARVFDLDPPNGGSGYSPGYVLHDGYLTIGTNEDALETLVERLEGDGDNLSSVDEYRRAVGHLPDSRQFLVYVDLHHIIDQLDRDDLELTSGQYRALAEGFSKLAVSYSNAGDYSRVTLALTLLAEE